MDVVKELAAKEARLEWCELATEAARLEGNEKYQKILQGARLFVLGGSTSTMAIRLAAEIEGYVGSVRTDGTGI